VIVGRAESIGRMLRLAPAAFALACGGHVVQVDPSHGHDAGPASVGNYCPTTLAQTNGVACTHEGLDCTQEFDCDGETQSVTCTCESAQFDCQDPIGLLPPGHAPRCLGNDPAKYYCPPSMVLAGGLTCDELGESCYYDGEVCKDGLTKLNYCECEPNGHGGHTFACHIVPCENLSDGGGFEDPEG
jgi:hypothetical protein